MANVILIKRGQETNLDNLTLQEGELALAFKQDMSGASLYAGNGEGKLLLNPDSTATIGAAVNEAKGYTDAKISDLVNGAPAAMDTLKELSDAISSNSDLMTALNSAISNKVDKDGSKVLSTNDYTTAEKNKLAGVEAQANNYTHPATHPASIITDDAAHRFVTDTEKSTWNSKLGSSSTVDGGTF